jgi:hypothetical protein
MAGKIMNVTVIHIVTHVYIGHSLKECRRKLRGILLNAIIFKCSLFESNKVIVTKSESDLPRQTFLLDDMKRLQS